MKTYTITRGHQYDKNGYSITDGQLRAWGSPRGNSFSMNGHFFRDETNQLAEAIRATMQDGLERIVTIGAERPERSDPDYTHDRQPCPDCGTYCYGDCRL
jgi:hypothetical protein